MLRDTTPLDTAHQALRAYGLSPTSLVELVAVSENATYRVTDDHTGRSVALRVNRPGYHSARALASEVAWIDALRSEAVIETPSVVRTVDDQPLTSVGSTHVTVFDWVDGHTPDDSVAGAWMGEIGAVAARLHAHGRRWRRPVDFTRMRWGFGDQLGESGHWGRWQDSLGLDRDGREVLARAVALSSRRMTEFGSTSEVFGLIHADLRAANLIASDSGIAVIDFDDCGFGWYLSDLAASLSFVEHRPDVPELIDAWLTGYRTVAPVTAAEEAIIPVLVTMRRILLTAWVASHPEADTARDMGADFTAGTIDVADRLLHGTLSGGPGTVKVPPRQERYP